MKKRLIVLVIALVIIIAGLVMIFTKGLNLGDEYGKYTMINIYMTDPSNIEDVRQIADEVIDGDFTVSYTDEFNDTASIKVKSITDEQVSSLKEKLKAKYSFEDVENNVIAINVPSANLYDLVKVYIAPIIVALALSLIYFVIAFRKIGVIKALFTPLITVVGIVALYISIIAIFRIAITEYLIPIGILLFILTLLGNAIYLKSQK